MNEHIISDLGDGFYLLTPEIGYYLVSKITYRKYSEAVISDPNDFEAKLSSISPIPHERILEDAKKEKIKALRIYDTSTAINSFSICNITTWISKEDRSNLRNTCIAYQERGDETVNYMGMEIPIATALHILPQLDIYAAECFKQTKRYEAVINQLTTIKDADEYDFTQDYSDKLEF